MARGSGWNLWVWLVGVIVRRYYKFSHITYPYSSCIYIILYFFLPTASLLFFTLSLYR